VATFNNINGDGAASKRNSGNNKRGGSIRAA